MKALKKIRNRLSIFLIAAMIAIVISMQLFPVQTATTIGYRFYTVLTDSMEPTIPTFSLVLVKLLPQDYEIKPNTIITFKADRFNEDILLTHYFRKTQKKDGVTYYRTQAEGKDNYDNYETKRSDIIGKYIFHIPYLGKIFLFLKSKFGFLMYAELFVIWLINKTIKTRWEEKNEEIYSTLKNESENVIEEQAADKKKRHYRKTENTNRENEFELRNMKTIRDKDYLVISGIVINKTKEPLHYVVAEFVFYDADRVVIKRDRWYLIGRDYVPQKMSKVFEYIVFDAEEIEDFTVTIKSYKK